MNNSDTPNNTRSEIEEVGVRVIRVRRLYRIGRRWLLDSVSLLWPCQRSSEDADRYFPPASVSLSETLLCLIFQEPFSLILFFVFFNTIISSMVPQGIGQWIFRVSHCLSLSVFFLFNNRRKDVYSTYFIDKNRPWISCVHIKNIFSKSSSLLILSFTPWGYSQH